MNPRNFSLFHFNVEETENTTIIEWSFFFFKGAVNSILFAWGLLEGISLWDTEVQLNTSSFMPYDSKKTAKSLEIFING